MSLDGFYVHSRTGPYNQRPDPATHTETDEDDDDAGESVHPSGAL
jgi:hypothetical protein